MIPALVSDPCAAGSPRAPRSDAMPALEPTTGVVVPLRPSRWNTSRGMIIGHHASVRAALVTIQRVAKASCTVLVSGESGTGKELFVAALHDASPRAGRPLVAVNCGAIPEALIESELFGHAKGAYTGAHATRRGLVAEAEGGTLFLDEIGELPLQMQVKILRLLQAREYSPVGDARTVKCDIRVVAATHRDLEREVAEGRFREDLYYRLNVIHLPLPALRERTSDIEALAAHFLQRCCERAGRDDLAGFTSGALQTLAAYAWPGNIRELENTIERAVLLTAGPWIDAIDLPARIQRAPGAPQTTPRTLPDEGLDLRASIESYETDMIRQALVRSGGNKSRAATLLRLNRTTLVEMMKRKHVA